MGTHSLAETTTYLTSEESSSIMKVLLVLSLAVFTVCNASPVWEIQPKAQLDIVTDAFWGYVAKATKTAEETMQNIKLSELGQQVNAMISESSDAVNKYTVALRGQVTPLTEDLLAKITKEGELLKTRLEQDLTTMKGQLKPYAEELNADLQKQVVELMKEVNMYVDALDSKSLRASVLNKGEELKASLEKKVKVLKAQFVPHAEEVKEMMEQNLDAFQTSMVPLTKAFQSQLEQGAQDLQKNLAPYGEQLKKLELNAEDLKIQINKLWDSFKSQ